VRALLAAAVALWAAGAAAEGRRLMDDAEASRWLAVGRLNAAGAQFCTAALIAPDLVLTADHCLDDARTGRPFPPRTLKFVAGYRKGGYAALRGVKRMARSGVDEGSDLALLELSEPIPPETVTPLGIGGPSSALAVVVSYGRDRAHAPSLERGCPVAPENPTTLAMGCRAVAGMSGAPVMAEGPAGPEILGVVSRADAAGRVYAATAAPILGALRARLSGAP
jgi:V8-like Glu-specific endopeptidase